MIINHNMASLNTYRQLSTNNAASARSLEKLSSGLRINKAGDDAAGLAISEKMRGQIRGLDQASRNSQDAISLIQTAEGALNETHSILQRMRELADQSANDTNTNTDRIEIQKEINQLTSEINRIGNNTEFNTKKLINGEISNGATNPGGVVGVSLNIQVGANAGQKFNIDIYDMRARALGVAGTGQGGNAALDQLPGYASNQTLNGVSVTAAEITDTTNAKFVNTTFADGTTPNSSGVALTDATDSATSEYALDVTNYAQATAAVKVIDKAIEQVSAERSKIGAFQNRLEHTIANLGASSENLTAAESRVRDVDMAKEMMNFQKNNILSQAAQAMLAQANQAPQGVLQLLR